MCIYSALCSSSASFYGLFALLSHYLLQAVRPPFKRANWNLSVWGSHTQVSEDT